MLQKMGGCLGCALIDGGFTERLICYDCNASVEFRRFLEIYGRMKPVRLPDTQSSTSGAIFSIDRKFRYILWRRLSSQQRSILVVGLNPSTANEFDNDPTIRRCIGFANAWGYSILYVANLFAYCATDPRDLKSAINPIGPKNDHWLITISEQADLTLVAWGNGGLWQNRASAVTSILASPHCLGITKRGAPRHPLYVMHTQRPIRYG